MLSTIRSIYKKLYSDLSSINPVNFPYMFSPKFVLKAFNSFADMPISTKSRFAFILSTLIDQVFHEYRMLQRSVSIEMPNEIKNILMRFIHKVRGWSGDRKVFA